MKMQAAASRYVFSTSTSFLFFCAKVSFSLLVVGSNSRLANGNSLKKKRQGSSPMSAEETNVCSVILRLCYLLFTYYCA
jgi:hypothetical protein